MFFNIFNNTLGQTANSANINDNGITVIMYHRFEENKYPSTNIKKEIFLNHINIIKKSKIELLNLKDLTKVLYNASAKKYLIISIDDAFESFFFNSWPILKKDKIPFTLFVSTEAIGKKGYMTWNQIKELNNYDFVTIGNHSHSHNYLADLSTTEIRFDLKKSIELFKKNLGYEPKFFSYPFGEYSEELKNIVKEFNFELAFGQHSGVIDSTKDLFELPRFSLNEKYGSIERFNAIIKYIPFPYKQILPKNKYLNSFENPPDVRIKFFPNSLNIKNITCFSNEGNTWKKSNIIYANENEIKINLIEKFKSERGRINCSLRENDGRWRWLGIQFVIAEY